MKSIRTLSVLLAASLCAGACGLLTTIENPKMEEESPGVYQVNIPAVMYDLPITFNPTDKIYLYNVTQGAFACDQSGKATALTPQELNENGTECVLKGSVSFYKYDEVKETRKQLTVGEDDVFRLMLNVTDVDTETPDASVFSYVGQDGTKASALAHYYAETTDVKMNSPGSVARFFGMQSLLTAGMTFRRDGATVEPTLAKLTITTDHCALASTMRAVTGEVWPDKVTLTRPNIADFTLSLASEPLEEGERLYFLAQDTEGHFYSADAEVPDSRFMAGVSYDCRLIFDYTMSLKEPTVTRNDGGAASELTPDADNTYQINPKSGKIDIRIDGDCTGYKFVLLGPATVTLGGGGTAYYPFEGNFLATVFNDLNVVLDSDYTVSCPDWKNGIMADLGQLKFSTTGGTHKLTVTAQIDEFLNQKGLKAQNYDPFDEQETSALAANGYSVTLTSEKDNGDGTGTYVYTVAPAN